MIAWIWLGIGIIVLIAHMRWLYHIAQSRRENKLKFVGVLLIPFLGLAVYVLIAAWNIPLWMYIVFVVERILWGITLYRAAGEDRPGWYIVIYIIPIIGWLIYYIAGE